MVNMKKEKNKMLLKGKLKQNEPIIIIVKKKKIFNKFKKICDIFDENSLKASIVSKMNVRAVPIKYYDKNLVKKINILEKKYGIQNIATNYAIVILVSAMETFLKDAFIFLVNNNKKLLNNIFQSEKKIEFKKVSYLLNKKLTIGEILADEDYNFQNLYSINKAYKWLCNIDIFKIIESTKRHKESCPHCGEIVKIHGNPQKTIKEIINLRHKIIHNSYIKKGLIKKYPNLANTINIFITHLCRMLIMKNFECKIITTEKKI